MATAERLLRAVDDDQPGDLEPLCVGIEQAARLLAIPRSSAYELIAQHGQHLPVDRPDGRVLIPVLRIGRRWVVPRAALTNAVQPPAASP